MPSNGTYQPDITSYDYDAPLDEAGDPTPKYFAIRDLLFKVSKLYSRNFVVVQRIFGRGKNK